MNNPGQDYSNLIGTIEKFPGWAKVLKSQWFVYYNGSANDIFNILSEHMDKNDNLYVCEITQNQQGWINKTASDWLSKHLGLMH